MKIIGNGDLHEDLVCRLCIPLSGKAKMTTWKEQRQKATQRQVVTPTKLINVSRSPHKLKDDLTRKYSLGTSGKHLGGQNLHLTPSTSAGL